MEAHRQTLKNLGLLFLRFMAYTKKVSAHSLKAYKIDLRGLLELGKMDELSLSQKIPSAIKITDKKRLEKTIKFLIEKNTMRHLKLAASSRNRKLAVAKSFIKWLAEYDYIDEDFRHLFRSPKAPGRVPSFLSVDEIFAILEMFKAEEGKAHAVRDQALFFLLYGGGLRVSEACHLKNKDIDWDRRTIKIKGKGSKERLVSLPKKALASLNKLRAYQHQAYVFGRQPLSERKAYDIIKSIGQKAGLLKPLRPHALRHSFATHMLSGGADLRILQELLGHKTLLATQKYTHLDLAHLYNALEKYHPLQKNQLQINVSGKAV